MYISHHAGATQKCNRIKSLGKLKLGPGLDMISPIAEMKVEIYGNFHRLLKSIFVNYDLMPVADLVY